MLVIGFLGDGKNEIRLFIVLIMLYFCVVLGVGLVGFYK